MILVFDEKVLQIDVDIVFSLVQLFFYNTATKIKIINKLQGLSRMLISKIQNKTAN